MDQTAELVLDTLITANVLYARSNSTSTSSAETATRPPIYKAIGISLAIASGLFIGVSFVLKKMGLLKANEKYEEVAGEGYGYLKNTWWWTGMTLMIIGEICNFVAYAFVDAILVTPLGALAVVITTILSAIFLKERLSMVGKVGCFLCIIGSVVIVMNAPSESSAANIQEMQRFVISPGFLSYAGVIIVGCAFIAIWAGPRYGKKSMLVYLTICSLIGGLSVVATQGLGAAIVAQIGGTPQFNQWFLYVLLVFVITTLVTEIIYLNKALNLFNAALVTPTYYVYFTSSTIITSAILFRGFKGTVTSIVTVVMGFFIICSGVVLLQLSKSAKDVPDAAVFAGDLDQVRTIAEQEQPETEPKADAIRGAAAIVRRFSTTRQKMELEEAKRLHDEKQLDLMPIGENEHIEWDGLRRRRTTYGTTPSIRLGSQRGSTPFPLFEAGQIATPVQPPTPHPPLGMSRFPDPESDEESRPATGGLHSSFFGTIGHRARSVIRPSSSRDGTMPRVQSPMHPVPLTEISIPADQGDESGTVRRSYYGHGESRDYGLQYGKTEYEGAASEGRHITIADETESQRTGSRGSSLHPTVGPTPPPHSARRQFSFQNVFRKGQSAVPPIGESSVPQSRSPMIRKGQASRRSSIGATLKGATEEERLGLVKSDTNIGRNPLQLPTYEDDEESDGSFSAEEKVRLNQGPDSAQSRSPEGRHRSLTSPVNRENREKESGTIAETETESRSSNEDVYESPGKSGAGYPYLKKTPAKPLPRPPYEDPRGGGGPSGDFI